MFLLPRGELLLLKLLFLPMVEFLWIDRVVLSGCRFIVFLPVLFLLTLLFVERLVAEFTFLLVAWLVVFILLILEVFAALYLLVFVR